MLPTKIGLSWSLRSEKTAAVWMHDLSVYLILVCFMQKEEVVWATDAINHWTE